MEPPKLTPITTLGKLGASWEVPFLGGGLVYGSGFSAWDADAGFRV